MQQVRFINNQLIINMFRAYLRPSSGGRTAFYCRWFPFIVVMMLESRVVRCVHCDEDAAFIVVMMMESRVVRCMHCDEDAAFIVVMMMESRVVRCMHCDEDAA
jgi:hypothetical protein